MWFTLGTLLGSLSLLITPVLMIIGLINPGLLSKIIKFRSFISRKQVLKEGILAFVGSFIVTGFSASNAPKSSIKQEEKPLNSFQSIPQNVPPPTTISDQVVSTKTTTATPTPTSVPTLNPSPSPTMKPVSTIQPTIKPTPKPTNITTPKPISQKVTPQVTATGSWACDCSKTCPNMSCAEAQYQLKTCGCKKRDGDGDGIACDSQCQ